ncbi:Rpn family recombination-promoting nuclease/putative transposase [Candidatus Magnetaquicoccus inordinatus]|uniref:Rpn family recombination-promoting nuclease/putative transposase n=1 Tax=Candidatus Magnetaquicoccus inordinatus TaxID=2496818 RepID=UPI00102AADC0|nr:hypothetical protein [Candidatus Magnetaquicoccus inordinatus]
MNALQQPYDRLCKALLANPESTGLLLRENLPVLVVKWLAEELPELVEGRFVSEELFALLFSRSGTLIFQCVWVR